MRWIAVMLLIVGLAGCAADEADLAETQDVPDAQYEDPDQNFTLLQPDALNRTAPAPGERTLAAAPEWRLGEWWDYRIEAFLNGQSEEITRVVAGSEHGNYLVGFPIDEFSNFAMVLHHPAFGDIHKENIDYETHDSPFKHVDFPLTQGKTWDTTFESENVAWHAEVTEVDEAAGTARIDFTNDNGNPVGHVIYDAELGEASLMFFNGYGQFEVLDHGYEYEGDVRVPHDHDLVFYHGRLAGVLGLGAGGLDPTNVQQPSGTIDVPEGYDRVSFGLLAQDIPAQQVDGRTGGTSAPLGYYSITVTAPQGDQYSMQVTPADSGWFIGDFYGHEAPAGTWTYDTVAGGAGGIFIEGIGYHSIDIALPSGCVIASENSLHHVTLCKAD